MERLDSGAVDASFIASRIPGFFTRARIAPRVSCPPSLHDFVFVAKAAQEAKQVALEQKRARLIATCQRIEESGGNTRLHTVGFGAGAKTLTAASAARIIHSALSRDDENRVFLFRKQGCGAGDDYAKPAIPVSAKSEEYLKECEAVLNMLTSLPSSKKLTEEKYDLFQRLSLLQYHEGPDCADSVTVCSFDEEQTEQNLLWVQDFSLLPLTVDQFVLGNA
jgi:hypothetical protein